MEVVFDNIIYSLQHAGGVSVVWTNLIRRAAQEIDDAAWLEYDNATANISRKTFSLPDDKIMLRQSGCMKFKRYINPRIKLSRPFIFHSSYYRTCPNKQAINVTTVHDFTYEYYVADRIKRSVHCWQKYKAILNSDAIVCISENTKKDLLKFVPKASEDKIKVIYNGVDDTFHTESDHSMGDFVLFVGKRDPYKNFDKIIEPVANCGLKLMIAGHPLSEDETAKLESCGCDYRYLGFVSNEELNHLYNHAVCLLYPSEYEGFGLPVLEAQKAGCPVVAYNASSIPEVIGDTPLLLNTLDRQTISDSIRLAQDQDKRFLIIENGLKNSARFSWDKMAQEYFQLYRSLSKTVH